MERILVGHIRKHLKEHLAFCKYMKYHGNAISSEGEPDIFAAGYLDDTPVMLAIEAKVHPNFPTSIQMHKLYQWNNAGVHTAVIYNIEELHTFLEAVSTKPRWPVKFNMECAGVAPNSWK